MAAKAYQSLKDHVYSYITELVNSGTLSEDRKINEQLISDTLGVSRTPVREALIQLSADGYIENVPRKGFFVKSVGEGKAREIVEVIGPLDGRAAKLACEAMSDEDVAQMRFTQGAMQLALENGLHDKYRELNREFHNFYIDKCGNQELIDLLDRYRRFFMKGEYAGADASELGRVQRLSNEEHKEIVRLFEERDGAGLQRYIRDVHWDVSNAPYFVW